MLFRVINNMLDSGIKVLLYLHDHLDGGQRGGDVLWVRRSHRDRHTTGIKAAIKRHDEVDTWRKDRKAAQEDEEEEGERRWRWGRGKRGG